MVDLPDPVGPVTRIIPNGLAPRSRSAARAKGSVIRLSRPSSVAPLSSSRSTTFSPWRQGRVLTRKSVVRPRKLRRIRPSWGIRRSEMSRSAMILKREVMAGVSALGSFSTLRNTPSCRKRISRPSSWGSTWMSLAEWLRASIRIRSTRLITGERFPPWLASRSSASTSGFASPTPTWPSSRSPNREAPWRPAALPWLAVSEFIAGGAC